MALTNRHISDSWRDHTHYRGYTIRWKQEQGKNWRLAIIWDGHSDYTIELVEPSTSIEHALEICYEAIDNTIEQQDIMAYRELEKGRRTLENAGAIIYNPD